LRERFSCPNLVSNGQLLSLLVDDLAVG